MTLTPKQAEAQVILSGEATHLMLEGGSRSGKTFLLIRATCARAIKAPGSRHGIFRFRFNHIKASIIQDTFPKVMSICFPGMAYDLNRTDWMATLPNGAELWFGGLDDKARTEKVLGREFATIYLNEISQIGFEARDLAITRLAQKVDQVVGGVREPLPLRMYYDLNPTNKGHWGYRLFHDKRDPETKKVLSNPADFAYFGMNPEDNKVNLSSAYLAQLQGLSAIRQRRFLRGEWSDENPDSLFNETDIDKWRVIDGNVPQFVRIVVAVDPSGADDTDNAGNDEIGIVVVGLGADGRAYLLEDCSIKAGPGTWGKVATNAFERHEANVIVGEKNYGGAMVRFTIQVARPRTPYKDVTATRGKSVRAEPHSALYEQGKVCHVGYFEKLEGELTAFSTHGYLGTGSPNRADALIWALTELFPAIVKPEDEPEEDEEFPGMQRQNNRGWAS